jgi:hypothetical protein
MPVKKRLGKKRIGETEECALWADLFATGYSAFFAGDLEDLNFPDKYAANRAAPEAWTRLGRIYMETIWPTLGKPAALRPWAYEVFGPPK